VKQVSSILAALALSISLGSTGCNQDTGSAAGAPPPNPIDLKIDSYEKIANEYVRVAKKLQNGDVSITVKYIELEKEAQKGSAELSKEAPRMTPRQAQRVAEISAKTAPYLRR
jgi:hypothetical protein